MKKLLLAFAAIAIASQAGAAIYRVNGDVTVSGNGSTWATAFKTVQEGINAATFSDEVWVKKGTYLPTQIPPTNTTPTTSRDLTFYLINADIKLYGGFAGTETISDQRNPIANPTILSGDLDGSSGTIDAYHVLLTVNRASYCLVDGFTVQGGRSGPGNIVITPMFGPPATVSRMFGGGMYNSNSYVTVTNCIFRNNMAANGGGMYNTGGGPMMSNCTFSSNNSSGGNGGGMYNLSSSPNVINCTISDNIANGGGGIGNNSSTPTITNCTFSNNNANIAGGGITNSAGNAIVSNCTFYNNKATGTSGQGGGIFFSTGTSGTITNCIFYKNTTPSNAGNPNREEIYKASPSTATVTISNSVIRDYSGAASNNFTATDIYTTYPEYADSANAIGADGIWRTADDGLRLGCSSFAKDKGTGSTPATDILGNTRKGQMDLGAYEAIGSTAASNSIPGVYTTVAINQSAATLNYTDCENELLKINAANPYTLSGSTVTKVFLQSTSPTYNSQPYVRRYYDITPATNASTATAEITLYFTQVDFDDYNTNRGSYPALPTAASDTAGIASLRITQQHGTSTTGAPGSYTTALPNILITPTSITYNTTAARWEVTLPVTGFSGFFAHTTLTGSPLPVKLLSFIATKAGNRNRIDWSTTIEDPGTSFEITRSSNGIAFDQIGEATGKGAGAAYTFYDDQPINGVNYYRLKITEASGEPAFSNIAIVRNSRVNNGTVTLSPTPATHSIRITSSDASLSGGTMVIYNIQGLAMFRGIMSGDQNIDVNSWAPGIYSLHLESGEVLRIVRQ